jgi:hypothetical protein
MKPYFVLILFIYVSAQIQVEWGQCPPGPSISPPFNLKTSSGVQMAREAIQKDLQQLLKRAYPFNDQKMSHLEESLMQPQQTPHLSTLASVQV